MLSATLAPLLRGEGALPIREALARLSRLGYRGVQLAATDPETRPRDLSPSARRDLAAALARCELACSGIDLFIPPEHFTDGAFAARAFDAARDAIGLAADLGRAPVVLPDLDEAPGLREALAAEALHRGVRLAVPARSRDGATATGTRGEPARQSMPQAASASPAARSAERLSEPLSACVDCAASLAAGERPDEAILALGSTLGAVRVVDLTRSGMRGPIGQRGEARLDVAALRVALDVVGFVSGFVSGFDSGFDSGFRGLPVVDARQWLAPADGLARSIACWIAHAP
jgi:sugar phosphate isomerase/epimerase